MFRVSNHPEKILSGLDELRKDPIFADAILCVGSAEYPCHRAVLASSSPYFRAMFSSSLKESHNKKIRFNEMSQSTLNQIITFIYTGLVEINFETAQDLLAAANMLQYFDLVESCCDFLKQNLQSSNCLGFEWFFHLHSLEHLEKEAQTFAIDNFESVLESEEFLKLPAERLAWYLASSELEVQSEERLFESVVLWCENQKENNSLICGVFDLIRYNSMPPTYIKGTVLTTVHFNICSQCASKIKHLVSLATNILQQPTTTTPQNHNQLARPSTLAREALLIMGYDLNVGSGFMKSYIPCKQKWCTISQTDLPCALEGSSMLTISDDIIVTGGLRNGRAVSDVWCYSSKVKDWLALPPLNKPRSFHNCVACNQSLFVLGGTNMLMGDLRKSPALDSVEELDLSEIFEHFDSNKSLLEAYQDRIDNPNCSGEMDLKWKSVANIPCPRVNSSAVFFNGMIIEVGGTQYGIPVKRMETYKCSKCQEGTISRNGYSNKFLSGEQFVLPEIIEACKVVVCRGQLYILWKECKKFILMDPLKRVFKDLPSPCQAGFNCDMAVIADRIYLVSCNYLDHNEPSSIQTTIECFDTITTIWTPVCKALDTATKDIHCLTLKIR